MSIVDGWSELQSTIHNQQSKRNIIFLKLRFFRGGLIRLGRWCGGRRRRRPRRRLVHLRRHLLVHLRRWTAAGAVAPADELEIIHVHAQLAALAASLFVFPLIVLEPAFDEDRLALGEVLVDDLGGATESRAIDEGDFLALLTG